MVRKLNTHTRAADTAQGMSGCPQKCAIIQISVQQISKNDFSRTKTSLTSQKIFFCKAPNYGVQTEMQM